MNNGNIYKYNRLDARNLMIFYPIEGPIGALGPFGFLSIIPDGPPPQHFDESYIHPSILLQFRNGAEQVPPGGDGH